MKYQIYLNQKATSVINTIATSIGQKPSTFIKAVLEQFAYEATPKMKQLEKELKEALRNVNEAQPKSK